MTFTVEQIEAKANYEGRVTGDPETEAMLLDYAAMKRREAGEVVGVLCVVTDEDSQYGISAHFSYSDNIAGLAPGDYECYTSPPSQPSTGVPDGWQLVPIELTYEMLSQITLIEGFTHPAMTARYKAMLAAAPRSP